VSESKTFEKTIRLPRLLCAQEAFSGLLAAYWNGYNDRRVAVTEIEEISVKPCQALFSIIS
jgi:hypothetical protein